MAFVSIKEGIRIPARRKANKAEVAEFFEIDNSTLQRWIRQGCPVLDQGSKGSPWTLDLLDVARWKFAGAGEAAGEFDPDKASPKERKDWYDSEFRRRQLQERDRDLIPATEVEAGLASMVQQIVRTLDTLGDVLERDAGIAGDVVEKVHRVTDAAREELYRQVKGGLPG